MYEVDIACFICHTETHKLINITRNKKNNTIFDQIIYLFPEIAVLKGNLPLYICEPCEVAVESFTTFKKLCLEKYSQWKKSILRLRGKEEKKMGKCSIMGEIRSEVSYNKKKKDRKNEKNSSETSGSHKDLEEQYKKFICEENCGEVTEMIKSNIKITPGGFLCLICKEKFRNKLRHLRHHCGNSKTNTTCQYCDNKFENYLNLIIHMKYHVGLKDFQCLICLKNFTSQEKIQSHLKTHYIIKNALNEITYKCLICKTQFSDENIFISHIKTHDKKLGPGTSKNFEYIEKTPAQCSVCKMKFYRQLDLERHEKLHKKYKKKRENQNKYSPFPRTQIEKNLNPNTDFNCLICNKKITKDDSYKHLVNHLGGKINKKCLICKKVFKKHSFYVKHIKKHMGLYSKEQNTSNNENKCSQCDLEFETKLELDKHLEEHIKNKYQCCICRKMFNTDKLLNKHLQEHIDFKPVKTEFRCTVCKMKFMRDVDLKRHILIHKSKKTKISKKSELKNIKKPSNNDEKLEKDKKIGFKNLIRIRSQRIKHKRTSNTSTSSSVNSNKSKSISSEVKITRKHKIDTPNVSKVEISENQGPTFAVENDNVENVVGSFETVSFEMSDLDAQDPLEISAENPIENDNSITGNIQKTSQITDNFEFDSQSGNKLKIPSETIDKSVVVDENCSGNDNKTGNDEIENNIHEKNSSENDNNIENNDLDSNSKNKSKISSGTFDNSATGSDFAENDNPEHDDTENNIKNDSVCDSQNETLDKNIVEEKDTTGTDLSDTTGSDKTENNIQKTSQSVLKTDSVSDSQNKQKISSGTLDENPLIEIDSSGSDLAEKSDTGNDNNIQKTFQVIENNRSESDTQNKSKILSETVSQSDVVQKDQTGSESVEKSNTASDRIEKNIKKTFLVCEKNKSKILYETRSKSIVEKDKTGSDEIEKNIQKTSHNDLQNRSKILPENSIKSKTENDSIENKIQRTLQQLKNKYLELDSRKNDETQKIPQNQDQNISNNVDNCENLSNMLPQETDKLNRKENTEKTQNIDKILSITNKEIEKSNLEERLTSQDDNSVQNVSNNEKDSDEAGPEVKRRKLS